MSLNHHRARITLRTLAAVFLVTVIAAITAAVGMADDDAVAATPVAPPAPRDTPTVADEVDDTDSPIGRVKVGRVVFTDDPAALCFASGFLATVDRNTRTNVDRRFHDITLDSEELLHYPFLVITGNSAFELNDQQIAALQLHIKRGGFILASAGCSNRQWAASFRKAMAAAWPGAALEPLAMSHPVFHTLYDIEQVEARRHSTQSALYGMEVNGRLALIFSPLGLNDSGAAGGGCCCCGGNEIVNANAINANILLYALTR